MKPPRGLSADEAALWARVANTITPLKGRKVLPLAAPLAAPPAAASPPAKNAPKRRVPLPAPPPPVRTGPGSSLDASWERKLTRASLEPDFTLDLHGHTLDQAHGRLDMGLAQAKSMGARLVLLITGKSRPVDAADRGTQRGAIRAKVLDWLAAGPHAGDVAAIRGAHRRHGGDGALYIVLRRPR